MRYLSSEVKKSAKIISHFLRAQTHSHHTGSVLSRITGSGLNFRDFRVYVPGDDVRHLSATASAKMARPMIKTFEEEKDTLWVIATDESSSVFDNMGNPSKHDFLHSLALSLALGVLECKQKVAWIGFSDRIEFFVPPTLKPSPLFVESVKLRKEVRKTDLRPLLEFIDQRFTHRVQFFLFSDFAAPNFDSELKRVTRRHRTHLILGKDSLGYENRRGIYVVYDPETNNKFILDTFSKRSLTSWKEAMDLKQKKLRELARSSNAHFFSLEQNQHAYSHFIRYLYQHFGGLR